MSEKKPELNNEELVEKVRRSMMQKKEMQAMPKTNKLAQKKWFNKIVNFANSSLAQLDSFINFMANRKTDKAVDEVVSTARAPIVFGNWVLIICFGFFGIWGAVAPLNQASIAGGTIVVDSNKKTIQHKEGGVIKEILVKEGAEVAAGQVVMRLNDTSASVNREILFSRINTLMANEDRLIAERDEATELIFREKLIEAAKTLPEIEKIFEGQRRIFNARLALSQAKKDITARKIIQFNKQIEGINAQKFSAGVQLNKITEQVGVMRKLLASGNTERTRLLQLESSQAELQGRIGDFVAKIAEANQRIASAEVEMIHLRNEMLDKVEQELKETQLHLSETTEKMNEASDLLERTEIKSPISGIVNNMNFHTIGGVVPPNGAIMEIIPTDDKLVIEARIKPEDIDLVHPGLEAFANLNAYRSRFVPPVKGVVVHVSADIISDPNAANPEDKSFYKAKIEIDKDQFEENPKLKNIDLYPGMPASVLIVVGSRTFMKYLLDPILNTMRLSFKEE